MTTDEPVGQTIYIWQIIISSGILGIAGWLSLVVLIGAAFIAIWRLWGHHSPDTPNIFFGFAHIQALFFLLTNGIMGIVYSFCVCSTSFPWLQIWTLNASQILISLAINTFVNLFLVTVVALVSKSKSILEFKSAIGITITLVDFALILALVNHIVVNGY